MSHVPSAVQVVRQYFPQVKKFWDIQSSNLIEALGEGRSLLCLAPTGGGKSLIYQVAGIRSGRTTIVISPLVALMDQQAARLQAAGLSAVALHAGLTGLPYYRTVRKLFDGAPPQFLFVSPERLRFDGYLNHVLRRNRYCVGLVVVDEGALYFAMGRGLSSGVQRDPSVFAKHVRFAERRAPPLPHGHA